MENSLFVGSGRLFTSIVHHISDESMVIFPYEELIRVLTEAKEKGSYLKLREWQGFNRVYLIPDNCKEGKTAAAFISEWFKGILFVVTEEAGSSWIYKKSGADYVIISRPQSGYSWLPKQVQGIAMI